MNSKKSSIRPLGQRSINSTFLFRSSNRAKDVESKGPSQKGSQTSLSDFLSRKLHRSSVLPTSLQGKEVPFSSPINREESNKHGVGERVENVTESAGSFSIDGIFEMFKNVEKDGKDHADPQSSNEIGKIDEDVLPQTRKRKNLLDENEVKPPGRKHLAVLGEDSKPIQRTKKKSFASKQELGPLFNHYESGVGWWDESMEGVDNEEVGCSDVWEGVGSTNLGGLEWH